MARGAGGTPGGIGSFFAGLAMMGAGVYLLLSSIMVTQSFNLGYSLYAFGPQAHLTSGMVLIPFCIGVGMIFFDKSNIAGWALATISLGALVFGVIASIHFAMRPMSLFDLASILVLCFGGLGIFLRSLKSN